MLSPGPANLVSLVLSSRFGSRQVALFQCGILFVYTLIAFGMAVTAAQFGDSFQNASTLFQIVGGAFIVYLGIRLLLTTQISNESGHAPTFTSGVLLQIFNPKFPPVVITVLASQPDNNNFAIAGIIVAVGGIGLAMYSFAGSLIHRFASVEQHLRRLNIVFGLMLCAVGFWIAIGTVAASASNQDTSVDVVSPVAQGD